MPHFAINSRPWSPSKSTTAMPANLPVTGPHLSGLNFRPPLAKLVSRWKVLLEFLPAHTGFFHRAVRQLLYPGYGFIGRHRAAI
jgi:hypothetical protein